ncbi:MAG: FAD-dependent oxidoreductase [Gaiellales bacterium]|nr:MAG: FAD-dependent oxidoreductase [Gaiellales bacterium]
METSPANLTHDYDVIVIGAGPAGCESALAAAGEGACTLCLAISLDNVGFPPANPIIAEGPEDRRLALLAELRSLGGSLPKLLSREIIARELPGGMLVADRRNLGLAYKELLETTDGLEPRQALVTDLETAGGAWRVATRLGEVFHAPAVVVAAGTFLMGRVEDGKGGGRLGEIPADSLARSLMSLGHKLVSVSAVNMPRLDRNSLAVEDGSPRSGDYLFVPDGSQLAEQYMFGPFIQGSFSSQLADIRKITGQPGAWVTRPSWSMTCLTLAAGQVDQRLEAAALPGLFFAGRAAGTCNYSEAAASGRVAGAGAADSAASRGRRPLLTSDHNHISELCERIARQEDRPVTVRIEGPGC